MALSLDPTTEFQRAAELRDAAQRSNRQIKMLSVVLAQRGQDHHRNKRFVQVMLFTFGEAAQDPTYEVGFDQDWWYAFRTTLPASGYPCEA